MSATLTRPRVATRMPIERLVGAFGLASFAVIVVGAFVAPAQWNAPGERASAAHVAAYLQANHGRTLAALFIYSVGMGLFL